MIESKIQKRMGFFVINENVTYLKQGQVRTSIKNVTFEFFKHQTLLYKTLCVKTIKLR